MLHCRQPRDACHVRLLLCISIYKVCTSCARCAVRLPAAALYWSSQLTQRQRTSCPKAAYTSVRAATRLPPVQVVVDTEQTGKELLEKGKLRQRVTIIPLNKACLP